MNEWDIQVAKIFLEFCHVFLMKESASDYPEPLIPRLRSWKKNNFKQEEMIEINVKDTKKRTLSRSCCRGPNVSVSNRIFSARLFLRSACSCLISNINKCRMNLCQDKRKYFLLVAFHAGQLVVGLILSLASTLQLLPVEIMYQSSNCIRQILKYVTSREKFNMCMNYFIYDEIDLLIKIIIYSNWNTINTHCYTQNT